MINNKYSLVETKDGSLSLRDSEFDEQMHTQYGAYKESVYKHIIPSRINEIEKDTINIMDVGFGAGYNILSACETLGKKKSLNFVSFEYDNSAVENLKKIKFNDDRDEIYEKIIFSLETGEYSSPSLNIKLYYGDARKSIQKIEKPENGFDAVFHDPFSPKKNCEMWTYDIFKIIYNLISENGILTTYSSAPQIRMALLECGFTVGKSKNKIFIKDGTIASKNISLIAKIVDREKLAENKFAVSYRDPDFELSREKIFENYERESAL